MRWVSVLRAAYRSLVTVAVCSRRPLLTDQLVLSGLWFHSHCGPSVVPANVSVPVSGLTVRGGRGHVRVRVRAPQAPLTVCSTGQPSDVQVIGASAGTRPPG